MSNPTRCAACRYLRRKCTVDCVLAPYFPATHPERFACVHRIFGASNVTRMLQQTPVQKRAVAAESISYEAYWRVRDPIYGCVGIISRLQKQIQMSERELAKTRALLSMHAAQDGGRRRQLGVELASAVTDIANGHQELLAWDRRSTHLASDLQAPTLPQP